MKNRWTTEAFVEAAKAVHGGKYDFSRTVYTRMSLKVSAFCVACGLDFDRNASLLLKGYGCQRCRRLGRGNSLVYKTLTELGVGFEAEKTFPSLRSDKGWQLRFDAFVPVARMVIEYDDLSHYGEAWRKNDSVENIRSRDATKTRWAAENGYTLLRIPYWAKRHTPGLIFTALRETGVDVDFVDLARSSKHYWPTTGEGSLSRRRGMRAPARLQHVFGRNRLPPGYPV